MTAIPFEGSLWIADGFLVGGYPSSANKFIRAAKLRALLACRIEHIINTMRLLETDDNGEIFDPYMDRINRLAKETGDRVKHQHLSLTIGRPGNNQPRVEQILQEVREALGRGERIYVHSRYGRERVALIVGCWFADLDFPDPITEMGFLSEPLRASLSAESKLFIQSWRVRDICLP